MVSLCLSLCLGGFLCVLVFAFAFALCRNLSLASVFVHWAVLSFAFPQTVVFGWLLNLLSPASTIRFPIVLLSLLCRLFLCFRCPPFSLFGQIPPETVVQGWLCGVLCPLLLLPFSCSILFQLLSRFPHTSSQPFPLTCGHRFHSVSKAQAHQCECVIASFDAANDFVQQSLFPGFHLRIFHCFFQCSVLDLFCEL